MIKSFVDLNFSIKDDTRFKSILIVAIMRCLSTISIILILLNLSGCLVVAAGAIGAAGKAVNDMKDPSPSTKPTTKEAQPELVKSEEVKSVEIKPEEVKIEQSAVQHADVPAEVVVAQLSNIDTPSTQPLEVEVQPEVSMEIAMPGPESLAASNEEVSPSTVDPQRLDNKVINNTSLPNLTAHAWKIAGIRGVNDVHFKSEDSVIVFSKDSKFKAFLACNSIYGKYEANSAGKFLLRGLISSHQPCHESRDQEVLIESMLLAVDGYFIDNQTLYLGTKGKPVLAFTETSMSINRMDFRKPVIEKSSDVMQQVHKKSRASAKSVGPAKIKNKAQIPAKIKKQGVAKAKPQAKVKAKKKK